ncbi:MAG: sulfite oxidase-like oxidoreductase [Hadesarchaea archaeon]|nr:sulfite oxidase-like oxidoreductase [Hadesarchaea archaeon]
MTSNNNRVPPGQEVTEDFPTLQKGNVPEFDPEDWEFKVLGEIKNPTKLTWTEFQELSTTTKITDFHCVTGWTKLDCEWRGVQLEEIIKLAKPKDTVTHVMIHCSDDYTTNLPLEELMREDVLLAYEFEGKKLKPEHGGPLRLIVPQKYAYKSAKWVELIEFMSGDEKGYWEKRGYSNTADPWSEDRYSD